MAHRTLSGVPAEQRLPARQRSTAQINSVKQCRAEVRTQKSEVTKLSGVAPKYPVQQKDKELQRSTAQNPNGCTDVVHQTVNSDCPVRHRTLRCAHRQQTSPTTRKWLGAINTPQPPHSLASKHSEVFIHCKSEVQHFKT